MVGISQPFSAKSAGEYQMKPLTLAISGAPYSVSSTVA